MQTLTNIALNLTMLGYKSWRKDFQKETIIIVWPDNSLKKWQRKCKEKCSCDSTLNKYQRNVETVTLGTKKHDTDTYLDSFSSTEPLNEHCQY